MENNVRFPALGLEFNIKRAISIFGFDIYYYAIIIAMGVLLAYIYCSREGKRQGLKSDLFIDILLCGIPSGIIGGRLYYVLFKWDYYKNNLSLIFALRDGGLAIYGAIIFAVISVFVYLRVKKINVFKVFDIASIGLLIGQGIGRWGNFFNQEAFGVNTELPWGMTSENVVKYLTEIKSKGIEINPYLPVHPTFLYESIWNLAGALLLGILIKKKKFNGQIFILYIIWYGFGRMLIEGLRTDSLMIFNLRVSQLLAFVSVIAGAVLYTILSKKNKEGNNG